MRVLPCLALLALPAMLAPMPGCTSPSAPPPTLVQGQASMAFQMNTIVVTLQQFYDPGSSTEVTYQVVIWKSDTQNTAGSCVILWNRPYTGDITPSTTLSFTPTYTYDGGYRRWNICIKATYSDGTVKILYGYSDSSSQTVTMQLNELVGATECPCACD
jgi:hypothetical protein